MRAWSVNFAWVRVHRLAKKRLCVLLARSERMDEFQIMYEGPLT